MEIIGPWIELGWRSMYIKTMRPLCFGLFLRTLTNVHCRESLILWSSLCLNSLYNDSRFVSLKWTLIIKWSIVAHLLLFCKSRTIIHWSLLTRCVHVLEGDVVVGVEMLSQCKLARAFGGSLWHKLGPLHTQAKGYDHVTIRALDSHLKVNITFIQFARICVTLPLRSGLDANSNIPWNIL